MEQKRILWIARDKGGSLWAGINKPRRCGNSWWAEPNKNLCRWDFFYDGCPDNDVSERDLNLPKNWFPSITWENSPKQVELNVL